MMPDGGLRRLLVSRGLLTEQQIDSALSRAEAAEPGRTRKPLADILIEQGLVSREVLSELALSVQHPSPVAATKDELPEPVRKAAQVPSNNMGRYIRVRMLGRGGMGVVFQAWDRSLGRYVALKFLDSASPDDLKRFKREARIAAGLRHPNIASVHEFGTLRGRPYIAMDYIEGKTLDHWAGKIHPRALAAWMSQICDGLAYAHARGIIHRDIKPANLLVASPKDPGATKRRQPTVYIMDFGLAKAVSLDSSVSVSGIVMGTPHYMSPEQAAGDLKLDARSDIYSLGASMYYLLTKTYPIDGESPVQIAFKLQTQDPVPLRKVKPDIPADLNTIIMKCLEKDRSRRYQGAGELKADVDHFLAGRPISARPRSLADRVLARARRHRGWLAAAVLLLAMAALTPALPGVFQSSADPQATTEPAASDPPRTSSETVDPVKLYQEADVLIRRARTVTDPEARKSRADWLAEARARLEEAIRLDPENPLLRFARAEADFVSLDAPGAIAAYDEVLALEPGHAEAHYRKVLASVVLTPVDPELGPALALFEPFRALRSVAAAIDLQKVKQARKALGDETLHQAKRRFLDGLALLAEAKWAEAELAFDDASRMEGSAEATAFRVYAFLMAADPGDMRGRIRRLEELALAKDLTDAVTLEPNIPLYRVMRGLAWLTLSKAGRALVLEDLTTAITLAPGDPNLLLLRVMAEMLTNHRNQALTDLQRARTLGASAPDVRILDALLMIPEAPRQGVERLTAAVGENPDEPDGHLLLGTVLHAAGRAAEAHEAFDRYVDRVPEDRKEEARKIVKAARRRKKHRYWTTDGRPRSEDEPSGVPPVKTPQPEQLIREADHLAASGKVDEALRKYEEAIRRLRPVPRGPAAETPEGRKRLRQFQHAHLEMARIYIVKRDPLSARKHLFEARMAGLPDEDLRKLLESDAVKTHPAAKWMIRSILEGRKPGIRHGPWRRGRDRRKPSQD